MAGSGPTHPRLDPLFDQATPFDLHTTQVLLLGSRPAVRLTSMDASDDENMRTVRPESSPELSPGPNGNIDQVREQRPRYKSWRKKYRKMKARFETTLKENVSMYKTEQRLDGIARRLQEQNE